MATLKNKTYSYLKRSKGIVELSYELNASTYEVGNTFEDYNAGKWTLLTEEHLTFRAEHPGCSYREMFNLEMNPVYEPTEEELFQRAKSNKLSEISRYDVSTNVNSFILNGESVWLDKAMRVGLMNSMTIEKESGREYSTLWFNDKSYTVPVDLGIQMLSTLELYALACYNMTAEHKVNVQALTTREEIEAYDHTAGYPERLIFDTTGLTAGEAISTE